MRVVRRTTVAVPTLTGDGIGARLARHQESDRASSPVVKLSFPEHWNKTDVRGALYAMHGVACAYCGTGLTRGDRGDVEHFRPKGNVLDDEAHGGYWWLAYVFDNYLMSCSRCNQNYKRDRFPLRPGGVRVVYNTRANLHLEPRLLLNPSLDSVEEWLRVDWKDTPCTISPSTNLPADVRVQVEGTLNFFRINIDPKLLRERNTVRDEVIKALDARDFDKVRMLAVRYRPHSLVARQILAERFPAHIPKPKDELLWLMQDFMELLLLTNRSLTALPNDRSLKAQMEELVWSFAVLWRDPPPGTSTDDVEDFLKAQGIRDTVHRFYVKL